MTAAKKTVPRKLITALRLEKELKEAKLALRERDLQVKAAQEHAAAMQEVLQSVRAIAARARKEVLRGGVYPTTVKALCDVLEEWSPAP